MPIDSARPFQVRVARRDGAVVLDLVGALDLAAREDAAIALANVVSEAPEAIVVNLQGLSYMDSTGLQCLLRAKSLADAVGTRMAVLNGSTAPHRLLALTGMDNVIEMVDDLAQLDPSAVRSP